MNDADFILKLFVKSDPYGYCCSFIRFVLNTVLDKGDVKESDPVYLNVAECLSCQIHVFVIDISSIDLADNEFTV